MHSVMIDYINQTIMRQASKLTYTVSALAPSNESDLFNATSLVIWSGASDQTIFQDPKVNYAFRALHDSLHLKTRLGFSVEAEIELGRIQASQYESDLMRELIFCQVSMQASHYKTTGQFVVDDFGFTMQYLKKCGFAK